MPTKKVETQARADARRNRRNFTDVLKDHGVRDRGYMLCTVVTYHVIFGMAAHELRAAMGLTANANLRDHFDGVELSAVMLVEALAAKRIEESLAIGTDACIEVTMETARIVAKLVRADLSIAA